MSIRTIAKKLEERFPKARLALDEPEDHNASWWLDVMLNQATVTIQWRVGRGFGVLARKALYGEGPDEIYQSSDELVERVSHLLMTGESTSPPQELALRQLRERLLISQEELADILGIGQPSVSKLERKSDLGLKTLHRIIAALGGSLEVV